MLSFVVVRLELVLAQLVCCFIYSVCNAVCVQATQAGVDFRILMIAFLLIASFCVLFLDWYDG